MDWIYAEAEDRPMRRVHAGSARVSSSIAKMSGVVASTTRKHSSRPLQEQAQGSTGPGPLATAVCDAPDSAAEQNLEVGRGQQDRKRGSHPRDQRGSLQRREGNARR